jgi:hypothetical protein
LKLNLDRYLLYILVPHHISFKNAADMPLFCGEDLTFGVFLNFFPPGLCVNDKIAMPIKERTGIKKFVNSINTDFETRQKIKRILKILLDYMKIEPRDDSSLYLSPR